MKRIVLALAAIGQLGWVAACALGQSTTAPSYSDPSPGWMPLFNGQNLDNFYTFRNADGKNNDPQHVFKVENGMLHILDIADTSKSQENGYLATNDEFRNYRVRLQYKWGEKKFPVPRHPEGLPRDSGLLYLIYGRDTVWPQCVEFQIQEHDTGDIWLLNTEPRPNITASAATTQPNAQGYYVYRSGGSPVNVPFRNNTQRLFHSAEYDSLTDWNSVELYVTGNESVHVVNGHVNNAAKNIRVGRDGAPLSQGKLAIQAEANEIWYRNVEIKPLFAHYGGPTYKVLVFSKTAGFRHDSIPNGIAAVKKLGEQNHFTVDATEDAAAFTDANLKQYKAIVFMSTTGDVLNDAQQQAMINYIHAGGGFVGVHAASDTEFDWPWYGKLVGAYFSAHPSGTPTATVKLDDADDPATSSLPLTWTRVDEWYNFKTNPRADVHVLVSLDESSYQGGTMNGDHPITWRHDFEGGRSWYTAMGHTKESFADPLFLFQLLGGIEYAAGADGRAPSDAVVLFDGKDTSHWTKKDGTPIEWGFHDGLLESKTRAGDIYSKEKFDDCIVHVEFKVPAVIPPRTNNAITNEQSMGNSGIYLQGHYECQILDSFDHPLQDKNDIGAIYEVKDADMNAAQPAETWQTYDIHFRAPKWNGTTKVANARITSWLNGVRVQNDVEVPNFTRSGNPESPGPGPIMLQDHLNPVQFRNIWVKRL
jgi:type 1 glutamine amidotransferase